jgi:hypothetical protein
VAGWQGEGRSEQCKIFVVLNGLVASMCPTHRVYMVWCTVGWAVRAPL